MRLPSMNRRRPMRRPGSGLTGKPTVRGFVFGTRGRPRPTSEEKVVRSLIDRLSPTSPDSSIFPVVRWKLPIKTCRESSFEDFCCQVHGFFDSLKRPIPVTFLTRLIILRNCRVRVKTIHPKAAPITTSGTHAGGDGKKRDPMRITSTTR